MRIEKYHAEDMQEAFRLIKAELGPDAVVIQTKKVRLGMLGWLKKPVYEVIAAVDEEAQPARFAAHAEPPVPPKARTAAAKAAPAVRTQAAVAGMAKAPRMDAAVPASGPLPARAQAAAYKAPVVPGTNGTEPAAGSPELGTAEAAVKLESSDVALLREMKSNMAELKTAMSRLSKQAQFGTIANVSSVLVDVYQRLVDHELAEDLAQDIILKVNNELGPSGTSNYELVREYVRRHIQELITVSGPPKLATGKTKSIFLIGPTGVGKTTTLAKLAANYSLVEHKRVGLITVDTFRIAAIPQLRTYADIIGVQLEVVYTPAELGEALRRFADREVVLFDTPGGSPRNSKQLEVLKEYVDAVEVKDVYLAVASPTRYTDMLEVYRRFSIAPIDGLLFTKIDETNRFGPLVNLVNETKARLTYLTTGQNVPQDIELADSVKMAELLLAERVEA
jgi:flagellar biosynthesis protein FlhF